MEPSPARPRAPRTSRSGSESSSASRSRFTRTAGTTGAGASRALAGSTSRFTRTGLPREIGASGSRSRSRSRLTRPELTRDSDSRFPRVEPRDSRLDRPDIATTGRVALRRARHSGARDQQPIRSSAVIQPRDLYESPMGTNHATGDGDVLAPPAATLQMRAQLRTICGPTATLPEISSLKRLELFSPPFIINF